MTKKIILSGIVQGVGMRYFIHFTAKKHSLTGTVKNLYSGQVQCICQGTSEQFDLFLHEVKQSHPGSIDSYEIELLETEKKYDQFQILLY